MGISQWRWNSRKHGGQSKTSAQQDKPAFNRPTDRSTRIKSRRNGAATCVTRSPPQIRPSSFHSWGERSLLKKTFESSKLFKKGKKKFRHRPLGEKRTAETAACINISGLPGMSTVFITLFRLYLFNETGSPLEGCATKRTKNQLKLRTRSRRPAQRHRRRRFPHGCMIQRFQNMDH